MSAAPDAARDEPVRDQLFSLLMRRIDVLSAHRAGVLALLRTAPAEPPLALWLGCATRRSMRWMLEAVGIETRGLRGELRVKGLVAVWLWTVRAWRADESADLAPTMAALDVALGRAERVAGWLGTGSLRPPARMPADASAADLGSATAEAATAPAQEPPAAPGLPA
ncbi:MAG: TetR family transcriptional regulator [Proteobacteria bacterium]|nr:TetR family transcriptional regulator [Pseudomonadota bacterium]